jgi:hypothetical protein
MDRVYLARLRRRRAPYVPASSLKTPAPTNRRKRTKWNAAGVARVAIMSLIKQRGFQYGADAERVDDAKGADAQQEVPQTPHWHDKRGPRQSESEQTVAARMIWSNGSASQNRRD